MIIARAGIVKLNKWRSISSCGGWSVTNKPACAAVSVLLTATPMLVEGDVSRPAGRVNVGAGGNAIVTRSHGHVAPEFTLAPLPTPASWRFGQSPAT